MHRKLFFALLLSLLPLALFLNAPPARASTTITVNSTLDVIASDGFCTLREAIIAANTDTATGGCPAGSGADTIIIPAGTFKFALGVPGEDDAAGGDLDLKQNVTIRGNGSACAFNPTCTLINADFLDRAFDITTSVQVTMSGLDINGGYEGGGWGGAGIRNYGVLRLSDAYLALNWATTGGGGLLNLGGATANLEQVGFLSNLASYGGAISNYGTLTVTKTLFNFDVATTYGGGIDLQHPGIATITDSAFGAETATTGGGAIYNTGYLTLNRVSLSDNRVTAGNGGGLSSNGAVTLTNVTFYSNAVSTISSFGGAVYVDGSDTNFTNVTVYSNTSSSGGGIYNASPVWVIHSFKNTILYNNAGGNCAGGTVTSLGYNIDGANTCAFAAAGDYPFTNPNLGPFQYNGGWHFLFGTLALLPGSSAINSGTNVGCPSVDARNFVRVGGCDRGAFEYVLRVFLPLIKR